MRFEHPDILWGLLLALPGSIAFFWWAWRQRRRLMTQFINARLLPGLTVGLSPQRQKFRMALLVAALAFIIVTLARPQIGFDWEEARQRGLDVVVAIDTSRSMLAEDVAPNRLKRAKLAAIDLKRLARTDRIGLVAFAGGAFLQCPLSYDDDAFRLSVEELSVNVIPQGGTAIAEAIETALGAFKDKSDNHKVLVLFTDGEDHDSNALEAARNAAKEGLRIFTVGVGTPSGEMLRVTDERGRTDFIKDENGNAVKSRLNDALLKTVAQATEGFYLQLSGANTMNLLYERGLAPLPKSEFAARRVRRHHERYQWLLGLALVLLLVEMLLPERKRKPPVATAATSPNPKSGLAKALPLLALMMIPVESWAAGSREALKEYRADNYSAAQAAYEALLLKSPKDARLAFNAGAAAFQNRDFHTASNHFCAALTNASLALQQRAYYNLGSTQFRIGEAVDSWDERLKRWEEAVRSYRSVVALRTNDVDAVYNLQLVQQRVAELKERIRLREEDRQAKLRAEREAHQGKFRPALNLLQQRKALNPDNKEFDDYMQRLGELNEIVQPKKP